ncbi:D-alanine--D-alanine ligase [Anabaena aphanizomenioides LEGE 00250]|uniref:D-alanine--D-alanine ligase n=1 Tax=Sphaerospermopsis aphanizomenoides LEGE 00250 TaxID=2777972 RepID=A0ABR9VF15_9CYAN|nr:D-alanine--D-alanine ligase [Sphaerospermopsis aphanizomenoides]MBE9237093.1 D-alanine--D-alanine ligase [Sphaerospermopsis aphanizomenoides LEGE 00250]
MSKLNLLYLTGSPESDFFCNLSRLYAQDSINAIANNPNYDIHIAYITPDGNWKFPHSLSFEDIADSQPISLPDAIAWIMTKNIDVVVPQMFCIPGMTHYRALCDVLKIRYIGNTPEVMAITANKAKAKTIVAAAGVKVPHGEVLRAGDIPTITPKAVVKPASSDNSLGVSLVKDIKEYETALKEAFKYAEQVIVEEYIELGREVRCGIIEKQGELIGLPLEEYLVDSKNKPVRDYADKLKLGDDGNLNLTAKDNIKAWIVDTQDPITQKVQAAAKKCHQALGCRHYSLFDFRIDPNGEPYFLEAGLYCSYSPKSVIPCMSKNAGISLDELLEIAIKETLK